MQFLSVQIDKPFIRIAQIQKTRSGLAITSLQASSLFDLEHVKRLYTSNFTGQISSGISAQDLFIRPISLKIKHKRYLNRAIAFQADNTSFFPSSDFLFIPYITQKKKNEIDALFCTVSKDALRLHLEEMQKLKIDPDFVSSYDLALLHFVRWKIPSLTDAFVIDLGSSEWTCISIENRELKKSFSIPGGVQSLFAALWEDRKKILLINELEGVAKQIDLLQLKSHLNPHLSDCFDALRQELAKIIFSFHRVSGVKPVLFTGLIDAFGHFREFLMLAFKETVSEDSSFYHLDLEQQKFAISIGLSLQRAERPLQLRKDEFFPKKNWKQAGIFGILLILLSLGISASLYLSGITILEHRKEKLSHSLQTFTNKLDPEIKKEIFQGDTVTIEHWISRILASNQESPYVVRAPKVAEFLDWLFTHPSLLEAKKSGEPIEILDLNYKLEEYPKIDSHSLTYQAVVEIQFSSKSALLARQFHQALLTDSSMVDLSADLNWEVMQDTYCVSFSLKNPKVPYVP
ncbi:MAG TPA: hypothetical protein VJK48_06965 [Chlamydiales bacterium]|nr:hypothetical protein [Chlamydiales bacterium]